MTGLFVIILAGYDGDLLTIDIKNSTFLEKQIKFSILINFMKGCP